MIQQEVEMAKLMILLLHDLAYRMYEDV